MNCKIISLTESYNINVGNIFETAYFSIRKPKIEDADVLVQENNDTYKSFWLPLYENDFFPKFLVAELLSSLKTTANSENIPSFFIDNTFILSSNPCHEPSTNGAFGKPIQGEERRWIAWFIPEIMRNYVKQIRDPVRDSVPNSTNFTCLSPKICDQYTFDSSQSDVSYKNKNMIFTVCDLRKDHIPSLRALKAFAIAEFSRRYGAKDNEVKLYIHYPVRSRLSALHIHVVKGHEESGALATRSYDLSEVIDALEKNGYFQPNLTYHLHANDGSLFQILKHIANEKSISTQDLCNKLDIPPLNIQNSQPMFDLVVPCASKDAVFLEDCIRSLIKCCKQISAIWIISDKKYFCDTIADHSVKWFDEKNLSFTKKDLGSGWRYQQILKLCASFFIPGISSKILLVDADTIWHKQDLKFIDDDGCLLYSSADTSTDVDGYEGFFQNILLPLGLKRITSNKTAITHHMIFDRAVLCSLFQNVLDVFKKPIWEVYSAGKPSEWEHYFHFVFTHYPAQVKLRNLDFQVTGGISAAKAGEKDKDFMVCHSHRRAGVVDLHNDGQYANLNGK